MDQCLELLQREQESDFTLSSGRLHATFQQANDQLTVAFNLKKNDESQFDQHEGVMIMATSIAYYDMAFRRFADVVTMSIESVLFRDLCKKIDSYLRKKLEVFTKTPSEITRLLNENPKVARRRQELTVELQRLEDASRELRLVLPNEPQPVSDEFEAVMAKTRQTMKSVESNDLNSDSMQDKDKNNKNNHISQHHQDSMTSGGAEEDKKKKKKKWFG